MQAMSYVTDLVLAVFVVREVGRFLGRYRRLGEDVARGDATARTRLYARALVFQWASAALAIVSWRGDWSALLPDASLHQSPLVRASSLAGDAGRGQLVGVGIGLALGTVVLAFARRRGNRRTTASPWRRLVPDFAALLPVTARERLLWLAVAVSAGICEEIVFRGWLLHLLHDPIGLTGTALIAIAAIGFGLAHAYQGVAGIVMAALGGVLFGVLFAVTGSLLVPMLLHVAVDARFAILPGPRRAGEEPIGMPALADSR